MVRAAAPSIAQLQLSRSQKPTPSCLKGYSSSPQFISVWPDVNMYLYFAMSYTEFWARENLLTVCRKNLTTLWQLRTVSSETAHITRAVRDYLFPQMKLNTVSAYLLSYNIACCSMHFLQDEVHGPLQNCSVSLKIRQEVMKLHL